MDASRQRGPAGLRFDASGGSPILGEAERAALKAAVQQLRAAAGIEAATWSWKAVWQFVAERFGRCLSRRSCLRYLHRLGFVWKRPKRRLVKADPAKRAAFVEQYRALVAEAAARGAWIFFIDEAHLRADGDLRGLWALKGMPVLVDSTSPKYGEQASFYAAVCLGTGEVGGAMLADNSCAETSAQFLRALRAYYNGLLINGLLILIWDNSPAHRGEPIREVLRTPGLDLRLVALPAYSPDYSPAEPIWEWIREEVTANTCLGTAAKVCDAVWSFFDAVEERIDEVKHRCRTTLQALAMPQPAATSHAVSLVGSVM